jgi:hypothetical protein
VRVPAKLRVGIERYQASDADELAAFQLGTFGPGTRQVDRGRDTWLFEQNPSRSGDARDMWVCHREGAIVGQQAEIPFDLRVGPHERRAAWGIDLMVEEAWRLRGVGPALVATQLEHRSIVAGLNMSDQGFTLYERAGFTDLGIIPVYLRALDVRRASRLSGVPDGARRVAPVAGPALRALDAAASAAMRLAGVRLEAVDRFDERVDDVWNAALPDYPVLAHRDHTAVSWSIDQRPDRDRMRRYYLTRRGHALGYAVLRPAGTDAEPTVVVVDYLAPARWVAPLLVATAAASRREGAIAMSVKTRNAPADRSLRAAGFVRRVHGADSPIRFMVHCTDDADVCTRLRDPAQWFVTSADCDLEYAMTPDASVGVPNR